MKLFVVFRKLYDLAVFFKANLNLQAISFMGILIRYFPLLVYHHRSSTVIVVDKVSCRLHHLVVVESYISQTEIQLTFCCDSDAGSPNALDSGWNTLTVAYCYGLFENVLDVLIRV